MTMRIESIRCKNKECDERKHYHANYFLEENGIIVPINNPDTFFSLKECNEHCRQLKDAGYIWDNKVEK